MNLLRRKYKNLRRVLSVCLLLPAVFTAAGQVAGTPYGVTGVDCNLSVSGQTASSTICYNAAPGTLNGGTATGGSGTYTYQWQSSTDGSSWSNVSGQTGATYAPGNLTATRYYRRITSDVLCGSVNGANIVITVYATLAVSGQTASSSICSGTAPGTLTGGTATGGTGSYTYQWQSSANGTSWTNVSGATSATYVPGNLTTTTYYRRVTTSGSCGSVNGETITVTVLAAPATPAIVYTTGRKVIVPTSVSSPAGTMTATLSATGATAYNVNATITPIWGSPSGGLTISVSGSTVTFTGSKYGVYVYQVRAQSGSCYSAYRTDTVYVGCGALVAENTWKAFMCHNLGADLTADPFTPTYATNGAYYQWGRNDPAKSAPTSTGADASPIPWDGRPPAGTFGDGSTGMNVTVKSADDPCPTGFRVPSYYELSRLQNYNSITTAGTITTDNNCLDCWSLALVGTALPLPISGEIMAGRLYYRGRAGYYWTNRTATNGNHYLLQVDSNGYFVQGGAPEYAESVRCVVE